MQDIEIETKTVIVVGMNRPRLNKIMSLVSERQTEAPDDSALDQALHVELVPCLVAMGSYEGEDGRPVRYMSNFVSHDGSPMTVYLDDSQFRDRLDSVLMVGYEWHIGEDEPHLKSYFQTNHLEVSVQCVQPTTEFDTLQEEMDAFKHLDDCKKQQCMADASIGPAKMAKFVVDAIQQMKQSMMDGIHEEEVRVAAELEVEKGTADPSKIANTSSDHKPQHELADPELPCYACRMCRTTLLGQNHLAQEHSQNLHSFKRVNNMNGQNSSCQSLFCSEDVLAWLSPSGEEIEGKLICPKCSHKIGHWKWAGAQCSCGTWITPAIQIPTSKVDVIAPKSAAPTGLISVINPAIIVPANDR